MDYTSPHNWRLIARISITYGFLLLAVLVLAYVCYDLIRLAFFILVLPTWYKLFNLLPIIVSSATIIYAVHTGFIIARRETNWGVFFGYPRRRRIDPVGAA